MLFVTSDNRVVQKPEKPRSSQLPGGSRSSNQTRSVGRKGISNWVAVRSPLSAGKIMLELQVARIEAG